MTIIRVNKDKNNPYVMLNKGFINDPNLSMQAKAVLAYLLSKPDDWKVYVKDIVNHFTNGKHAVRRALTELINKGYLHRFQARKSDGQFVEYEYDVYEKPMISTANQKAVSRKSDTTNNEVTKDSGMDNYRVTNGVRSEAEYHKDLNSPDSTQAEERHKRIQELQ